MNKADAIMAVSLDYLQAGQRRCETEKPGLSLHLGIDLDSFDKRKNPKPSGNPGTAGCRFVVSIRQP